MKKDELAKLLHDLRAPLARAQTYAKLLDDANAAEHAELLPQLKRALTDLNALLSAAEEGT
jgi:signal transduction histidine kinase